MGYEELSSRVGSVRPARNASIVSCRKRNAERPRWAHVASTVQIRSHQERPASPRPLGDFAVDHDKAKPLFHGVVRGLDAWRVQKAEIVCTVLAKTLGDVLCFAAAGRTLRHLEHFALGTVCRLFPAIRSQDVPLVPHTKESFDRRQQPLAIAARRSSSVVRNFTSRIRCAQQNCMLAPRSSKNLR